MDPLDVMAIGLVGPIPIRVINAFHRSVLTAHMRIPIGEFVIRPNEPALDLGVFHQWVAEDGLNLNEFSCVQQRLLYWVYKVDPKQEYRLKENRLVSEQAKWCDAVSIPAPVDLNLLHVYRCFHHPKLWASRVSVLPTSNIYTYLPQGPLILPVGIRSSSLPAGPGLWNNVGPEGGSSQLERIIDELEHPQLEDIRDKCPHINLQKFNYDGFYENLEKLVIVPLSQTIHRGEIHVAVVQFGTISTAHFDMGAHPILPGKLVNSPNNFTLIIETDQVQARFKYHVNCTNEISIYNLCVCLVMAMVAHSPHPTAPTVYRPIQNVRYFGNWTFNPDTPGTNLRPLNAAIRSVVSSAYRAFPREDYRTVHEEIGFFLPPRTFYQVNQFIFIHENHVRQDARINFSANEILQDALNPHLSRRLITGHYQRIPLDENGVPFH